MPVNPGGFLYQVLLALLLGKILAEVFERRGLPGVLGEVLAGFVLGGGWLWFEPRHPGLESVADLGCLVLLFRAGLGLDLSRLKQASRGAVVTGTLALVLPFAAAFLALILFQPRDGATFLAAGALAAGSLALAARGIDEAGAGGSAEAPVALAALSVQNMLVVTLLPVLLAAGRAHPVWKELLAGPLLAAGFVAAALLAGPDVSRNLFQLAERLLRGPGATVAVLVLFPLALATLGQRLGASWAVGALAAGAVAGLGERRAAAAGALKPLSDVLLPVFFVVLGAQLRLGLIGMPWNFLGLWGLIVGLAAAAMAGRYLAGLAAWGGGFSRGTVALLMLPGGELGFALLRLGINQGLFGPSARMALCGALGLSIFAGAALSRRGLRRAA